MKKATNTFLIILIIHSLFLASCVSYSILPEDVTTASDIDGLYMNDCELTPFEDAKLWNRINPGTKFKEDGLKVSLKLKNNKRLSATLYKDSIPLETITIKGKIKDEQYFAAKRMRYIVPILPVLWWYENSYYRLFARKESIIIEDIYDSIGVVVIMASGNTFKNSWEFKRLKSH